MNIRDTESARSTGSTMRHSGRNSRNHAFTLAEILIALLVFSLAAVVLIGLFPLAHRTEKATTEETQATLISSDIMEGLVADKNPGTLRLPTGTSNGAPLWENIHPSGPTSCCIAYDSSCQPCRMIPLSEATNPVTDQTATALAFVSISRKRNVPDLVMAEVVVAAPPSAPEAGRTLHRFMRLLAVP